MARLNTRCAVVAIALVLCACADIAPIESNLCGNGVLEPAEDCDGSVDPALGDDLACGVADGTVRACRYTCVDAQCPTGTLCSAEGVCRAATGEFDRAAVLEVHSEQLALRDMDGDGALDLVGVRTTGVSIAFGDATGSFYSRVDVRTPELGGRAGFTAAATENQVVLPIQHGTHAVKVTQDRSVEAAMSGLALPPRVLAENQGFNVYGHVPGRPDVSQAMFMQRDDAGFRIGQVLQNSDARDYVLANPPTGAVLRPAVAELGAPVLGTSEEFTLAFEGDTTVRVLTVEGVDTAPTSRVIATVSLADLGPIAGQPLFAHVTADSIFDLVVPVRIGSETRVAVAAGAGAGNFADPVVDDRFDGLDQWSSGPLPACSMIPPGQAGIPIAAADLNGDGMHDFVTPWGAYVQYADRLERTHCFARRFTVAESGDLNRDGMLDIAALAVDEDGGSQVVRAIGFGTGAFAVSTLDTLGQPRELRVGDFDGDLVHDIAITQDLPAGNDAVSVSYGTTSGPAIPFATLTRQAALRNLTAGRAGLPADAINDLAFLAVRPESNQPFLVIPLGTSDRTMVEGFALVSENGLDHYLAGDTVVGDFTGDGVADLAIATSVNPTDLSTSGPARLWLSEGRGDGTYAHPWSESTVQVSEVQRGCVRWAAGNIDDTADSEMVGLADPWCIVPFGRVATLVVLQTDQSAASPRFDVTVTQFGMSGQLFDVRLVDLDGDGLDDVLATFHDRAVVLWNDGGVISHEPVAVPAFSAGGTPPRVAAVQADGDRALELVVADGTELVLVDVSGDRTMTVVSTIASVTTLDGALVRTGDIDRDGTQDVVVSTGAGLVEVYLGRPRATIR